MTSPLVVSSTFPSVPMQVVGGESSVAIAVFVGQLVAFALACWVGVRTYRGYRDTGRARPGLYWLAVGIVLLAAIPTALRFLLPTLIGSAPLTTTVLATSSEIAGLLAVLYAVFGNP